MQRWSAPRDYLWKSSWGSEVDWPGGGAGVRKVSTGERDLKGRGTGYGKAWRWERARYVGG